MGALKTMTANYKNDDVKLKEFLEKVIEAQHDYFMSRLAAIETASRLALNALDAKYEHFRVEIEDLKKYKSVSEGKASQGSVYFFGLLSVAALIISIIKMFG
jgi:hypothetical protein